MFSVGDKIVHPMHGAGIIDSIITRKIGGESVDFYVMKLPVGAMVVMIPVASCAAIGVRGVVDSACAERVMKTLKELPSDMTNNWNRRYRENMMKLKSGDLLEVATVIKGLMCRDSEKGLSTGERKMLHSAKQILISEIVLSQGTTYEAVEDRLNKALAV